VSIDKVMSITVKRYKMSIIAKGYLELTKDEQKELIATMTDEELAILRESFEVYEDLQLTKKLFKAMDWIDE
jgi:hypothetical protein